MTREEQLEDLIRDLRDQIFELALFEKSPARIWEDDEEVESRLERNKRAKRDWDRSTEAMIEACEG